MKASRSTDGELFSLGRNPWLTLNSIGVVFTVKIVKFHVFYPVSLRVPRSSSFYGTDFSADNVLGIHNSIEMTVAKHVGAAEHGKKFLP
jgi:hypothetical protein